MNDELVKLNRHFDYAKNKIKEINRDPEKRSIIMEYETKMLERERDAEEAGMKRGMQRDIERGMQQGIEQGMGKGLNQGLTQGTVEAIKNDIKSYRKFGISDEQILEELITNFADQIPVEKLKRLMKD